MKFHFSIEYKTRWGEELRVVVQNLEYPLHTEDGIIWHTDLELKRLDVHEMLRYHYVLYREGQFVWAEWEVTPHLLHLSAHVYDKTWAAEDASFVLEDAWRPIPETLPLFSSAYTDCVASHGTATGEPMTRFQQTLQLRIVEPRLRADQRIGICGNTSQLGNWETPVPLQLIGVQEWGINIDASKVLHPLEYKYVILESDNEVKMWEDGENRKLGSLQMPRGEMWVKTDASPRFSLPCWKGAGVVVPVFSLRSEKSFGVGDFGDLKNMIRWAAQVGMHIVQILPINDTTSTGTWMDSYPYNAISVYAFHPLYCDLHALPPLADKLKMETFLIKGQQLNGLKYVDYEAAFKLKIDCLRAVYSQEWHKVSRTKEFKDWFMENKHWLVPYAAFSALRDEYGTSNFHEWTRHKDYSEQAIARYTSPRGKHFAEVAFYYYVQYALHLQLSETHELARSLGVILKGDIPIGISPQSVEAWAEPRYFNLNSQAGAPPDDFSRNGQNWGFPTYNWKAIMEDGTQWWVKRLQFMANYFDAYRIDHVLGFFRIWDIPKDSVHGLLGQFSPALPLHQNEIESYGLRFNAETMTRPYITDDVLFARFGYRAELVKTLYLDAIRTDEPRTFNSFGGTVTYYKMKPDFDTQQKVRQAFEGKTDNYDIGLRDGLYALISDVLFVRDRQNPELYHPRISAQRDYAYKSLSEDQRRAFNSLYNEYFYHRHSAFWYREAMRKLPILTQSTRMLCCAEDLGMVPECVPWVMQELRLLSLEIQTMPKEYGVEFSEPSKNNWRSVATISTHDMPTMRQWWEDDTERAQRFFNQALHIDGTAPRVLPGWLASEIVNRHLYSPSMLCLLSLQDWLSIDESLRNADVRAERINDPANPRHYWRWRMHLNIEQLQEARQFNNCVENMIKRSGRN